MKKKTKKKKQIKKSKKKQSFFQRNKKIIIISLIIIILLIFISGTKLFLLINFLLGNDIIVKLGVDKEHFFLENGQEEIVEFSASVTTNPFCRATCKSIFVDISNNNTIDQDTFTLFPSVPLKKSFTLTPTKLGEGIDIYKFKLECKSKKTLLCHTDEEPTKRNILLTLHYVPNRQDIETRNNLIIRINETAKLLSELKGRYEVLQDILIKLNNSLSISGAIEESPVTLFDLINFENIKKSWPTFRNDIILKELNNLNDNIKSLSTSITLSEQNLESILKPYNVLIEEIQRINDKLKNLRQYSLFDSGLINTSNNNIQRFNNLLINFLIKSDIEDKKRLIESSIDELINIPEYSDQHIQTVAKKSIIQSDITSDIACKVSNFCIKHPNIQERITNKINNFTSVCKEININNIKLLEFNKSLSEEFNDQKYPKTQEFWDNISLLYNNYKINISNEYINEFDNKELIDPFLNQETLLNINIDKKYNLTPALINVLTKNLPDECNDIISIKYPENFSINKIKIIKKDISLIEVQLNQTIPQCCLYGDCQDCCIEKKCKNQNFPVVFLHGHAFNKETSAEYSLDAFNKIQEKLENQGFINAGAISLYTPKSIQNNEWDKIPAPLSIKASYYLDIFQEPENYIVVQTKSENIDTYALRLKELIDTINSKTGKDKINIVAHSMGGLVARRYIQVFGEDKINKLIMIATPNKGIIGNVADYCSIIGEQLECRDMNQESLFLNKLNREPVPNIPITNIIGTGCIMKEGIGDGVVIEDNTYLEGTKNIYVNGTCGKLNFLHTEILDIDKYPKVLTILKKELT